MNHHMTKYRPALPPREHQKMALRRIAEPSKYGDVFALLMEMGTGKSKIICDEWGSRATANDISDLLVIAPAGCYRNWIDDYEESPSEFRKQLDPEFYRKALFAKWVSGAGVQRSQQIQSVIKSNSNRPRAFVVNAEALSVGHKAIDACCEFLNNSHRGAMVVIDESPLMKSWKAIRTDTILELGEHKNIRAKRILSGLVTPNSPLDLYTQFQFLDWQILGFRTFVGFRARYAVMQNIPTGVWFDAKGGRHERFTKIVVSYRDVDELHEKIEPFSFRCLKSECLDLPPKQYISRDIELTKEQRRIYNGLKEEAFAKLAEEKFVSTQMVLTQRMRLTQVLVGYTMDEKGELFEMPEKRTSVLLDILSDYQGKALIWTSHDYCVRKLHRILNNEFGQGSCAQFWGGNPSMRGEEELRFKTDPACRFLVASPGAGGRGNNWAMAGLSVYYDNSDNLDHRLQSEDRNHRDGLTSAGGAGSVLYADLIAQGTIDTKRLKLLRGKIDIATAIHGDDYREWLI
jgi:hypothetical protein